MFVIACTNSGIVFTDLPDKDKADIQDYDSEAKVDSSNPSIQITNISRDFSFQEHESQPESEVTRTKDMADDSEIANFPADDEELYQESSETISDDELTRCHVNSVFIDDEMDYVLVPNIVAKYSISPKCNATNVQYLENGKILVTDLIHGKIYQYDKKGIKKPFIQDTDLMEPWATATLSDGRTVVTSRKSQRVFLFSPSGRFWLCVW